SLCCVDAPAPPVTYTLSLHDALPISEQDRAMVAEVDANIATLRSQGKSLPAMQPKIGGMAWPLGPYPGVGRDWHGISNFVDLDRSEEHTSELQSRENLVCRLLLEKKK